MTITLAPKYHEVTLYPTAAGLEVHCENASGDTWVIAFDAATYDMLACMILAGGGVAESDAVPGEQEEIPF